MKPRLPPNHSIESFNARRLDPRYEGFDDEGLRILLHIEDLQRAVSRLYHKKREIEAVMYQYEALIDSLKRKLEKKEWKK